MKGGLNRIVIDANKRAVQPWKRWQTEAMPADEWERQKAHAKAAGEAVICGAISGSLEVIDVDLKYDTDGHVRASLFPAAGHRNEVRRLAPVLSLPGNCGQYEAGTAAHYRGGAERQPE